MTDPEQSPSEILARRNVANIATKLKAGKTLTTSERKALNDFQTGQLDGWAKDTSALARELGLSAKRSTTRATASLTHQRSTRTGSARTSPRGRSSSARS